MWNWVCMANEYRTKVSIKCYDNSITASPSKLELYSSEHQQYLTTKDKKHHFSQVHYMSVGLVMFMCITPVNRS